MQKAKLFKNGQSQAVRLPKEFRFEGNEVFIKRVSSGALLIPAHSAWDIMMDSLDKFSDDFMEDREQPPMQEREDIFE
jgi:antitoxin VapB